MIKKRKNTCYTGFIKRKRGIGMRTEIMYLYEDRKDVTLTAYLLQDSPEIAISGKRPAMIINPGGAYVILSDREAEPIAMRFAAMGFQTFVLRYSVINGEENKWPEDVSRLPEVKKEVLYPAPVLELGKAMLLVKEHAGEWSINPEKVGVCGFSAGGHNAAMYASMWFKELITEKLHTTEDMLKPAFCIVGYPFIDWELQYNRKMDETTRNSYKWMYTDYFGTPDPTVEEMRACSPNYLVNEKTVPTFIWNTSTDNAVDPRHSLHLAEAMAANNIPCEYHMFGEGLHGLALANESTKQNEGDISEVVAKWVPLVEKWIRKIV